jgi:hypothetical protein
MKPSKPRDHLTHPSQKATKGKEVTRLRTQGPCQLIPPRSQVSFWHHLLEGADTSDSPWVMCLELHDSLQNLSPPLSQTPLCRMPKANKLDIVTNSSNGRKTSIYRLKGGLSSLKTAVPRSEPWEATTNVRCPREVREIETLTKAGLVQRR